MHWLKVNCDGGPLVAEVIDRLDTLTRGIPEQQTMPTDDSAGGVQKESAEEGSAAGVSPAQKNSDLPVSDPSKPIGDGPKIAWNGFWPLSVAEILNAVDVPNTHRRSIGSGKPAALGNRYLAKLANEYTLFGWNAVILLAQRDPVAASEFVTVLERLVSKPPYYDPQTRQPVAAPKTPACRQSRLKIPTTCRFHMKKICLKLSSEEILERLLKSLQNGPGDVGQKSDAGQKEDWHTESSRFEALLNRLTGKIDKSQSAKSRLQPKQVSPSMQAAVAETWCLVLAADARDPVENLAPAGRVLERSDLVDPVRGALFRGVARHVEPALIPRLTNALRVSNDGERVQAVIRRSAIDACLIYALLRKSLPEQSQAGTPGLYPARAFAASHWPETVLNCKTDPDPLVRRTFGRWLAIVCDYDPETSPEADALSILSSQLQDRKTAVRNDALVSLGMLGTEAARCALQKQASRPEEIVRTTAVRGLATWGIDEITFLANDASTTVRQSVAEQLARQPSVKSALRLRNLLTDPNLQVQLSVVAGVEPWPDRLAVPLLLYSLRESSRPARQKCFGQLRKRNKVTGVFVVFDASQKQQRAASVAQLARELAAPLNYLDQLRDEVLAKPAHIGRRRSEAIEADLRIVTDSADSPSQSLYAAALQRLKQLEPAEVSVIEGYLLKNGERGAAMLFQEVLPEVSPAYEALHDL